MKKIIIILFIFFTGITHTEETNYIFRITQTVSPDCSFWGYPDHVTISTTIKFKSGEMQLYGRKTHCIQLSQAKFIAIKEKIAVINYWISFVKINREIRGKDEFDRIWVF